MKKREYIRTQYEPLIIVEIPCGRCHGTGMIKKVKGRPYSKSYHEKKKAFDLYDKGYTLREVASMLKIKNAQTVKNLIDSYINMVELRETQNVQISNTTNN